jgi:hypothetical protein
VNTALSTNNLNWKLRQLSRLAEFVVAAPFMLLQQNKETERAVRAVSPIWVVGMYRSGTSIVTRILQQMGGDIGPSDHLYQPRGWYRKLNPEGFFENFLFEDIARYLLVKAGGNGDDPPVRDLVRMRSWKGSQADLAYHSIFKFHDERITRLHRWNVLRKYGIGNLDTYLQKEFGPNPVIKNGHLTFLTDLLLERWPDSRFVGVFRDPAEVLGSANSMEANTTPELWMAYNNVLLQLAKAGKCTLVHLGSLTADPESTIDRLSDDLGFVPAGKSLVDQKKQKQYPAINLPDQVISLYEELCKRA